jgi:hypothetical protein
MMKAPELIVCSRTSANCIKIENYPLKPSSFITDKGIKIFLKNWPILCSARGEVRAARIYLPAVSSEGWGRRIRTSIGDSKGRCPAIGRSPRSGGRGSEQLGKL